MKLIARVLANGCIDNCIKLQKLKELAINTDKVQQCKCTARAVYVWPEQVKEEETGKC